MFSITLVDDDGYAGQLKLDAGKVRRFTRLRPSVISISERMAPQRRQVERFLEDAYAKAFSGRIRRHYPILMSVWDASGALHAAAGFRFATSQPLFLEQYLDAPIEKAISGAFDATAGRHEIAEIGNLAATSAGASVFLFIALAGYLEQHGCRYAAATATRPLRRMFGQVGFAAHELCKADPARLQSGAGDWGSYYLHDPVVMAGEIAPAFEPLQRRLAAEPRAEADRIARLHYPIKRAGS